MTKSNERFLESITKEGCDRFVWDNNFISYASTNMFHIGMCDGSYATAEPVNGVILHTDFNAAKDYFSTLLNK